MENKITLNYCGLAGLLAECHLHLPTGGNSELKENIREALADFCQLQGFQMIRTFDLIELEPKEQNNV